MAKRNMQEDIEKTESDLIKEVKELVKKIIKKDIKVVSKNDSQKELIKSIKNNEITICEGIAGSGKTFIALAYALLLLRKETTKFKNIYLIKSVTTLKGEDVGYLKGDLKEKLEPFMWSYFINIEKIIRKENLDSLLMNNIIKPFPLAFARGATLDNCIIIGDEMQNVSLDNARTMLTRIGNNSKMILLGDTNQIDLKDKEKSSLSTLMDIFTETENIGTVKMDDNDTNVRNKLIDVMEVKFKEYYKKNEL